MDTSLAVMTSEAQCITCSAGSYCSVGAAVETPCAPGTYGASTGASTCTPCSEGEYQDASGQTACKACTSGYYCAAGSSNPLPCPAGKRKDTSLAVMTSEAQCITCSAGSYCSVGAAAETPCAPGTFGLSTGAATCASCPSGNYQNLYGQTACKVCPRGFLCAERAATPVPCKGGTFSNATGLANSTGCQPVKAGFWAPLGSAVPEPCPASGFYCPGAADDKINTAAPGSKPIIVPVGASTTEKQVESVQKEMNLDVSCADFNLEAVRASLAVQYGVDVSLISFDNPCARRMRQRARVLAGLTLKITIASEGTAADGTPVSAAVETLLQTVASVDDSTLAGSLGAALGTAVTVSSAPAQQATVTKTVKFNCPKGKWCTAGLIVDCPLGTYNNETGANYQTACRPCPEFSTTLNKSATSILQCVCQPGFTSSTAADGSASCQCAAGYEIMNGVRCDVCGAGSYKPDVANAKCTDCPVEHSTTLSTGSTSKAACVCKAQRYLADAANGTVECALCPVGSTNCTEPGVELETLPLLPDFWRSHNRSRRVRKCFTPGSCVGGSNTSALCRVGHSGPFCEVCRDGFYRDSGQCVACTSTPFNALIAGGVLATMLVLIIGTYAFQRLKAKRINLKLSEREKDEKEKSGLSDAVQAAGSHKEVGELLGDIAALPTSLRNGVRSGVDALMVKLRILISMVQVMTQLGIVYSIPYPEAYTLLLRWVSLLELNIIDIVPLQCVFPAYSSYYFSLLSRTLMLPALACVPLLVWFVSRPRLSHQRSWCVRCFWRFQRFWRGFGRKRACSDVSPTTTPTATSSASPTAEPATALSSTSQLPSSSDWFIGQCLGAGFYLLFLIYPSVSAKIFAAFQCELLDDGTHWLRADLSVRCYTTTHHLMCYYAAAMIVVYPIGTPLLYYWLLRRHGAALRALQQTETLRVEVLRITRARRAIEEPTATNHLMSAVRESERAAALDAQPGRRCPGICTRLHRYVQRLWASVSLTDGEPWRVTDDEWALLPLETQAELMELSEADELKREALPGYIKKLINGYELRCLWFEIFECVRKLAIACVPVFFVPSGSVSQLIFGLVVCFGCFAAYVGYHPFEHSDDDLLAKVCQAQTFFALLSSVALSYDVDTRLAARNLDALLVGLAVLPAVIAILLQAQLFAITGAAVSSTRLLFAILWGRAVVPMCRRMQRAVCCCCPRCCFFRRVAPSTSSSTAACEKAEDDASQPQEGLVTAVAEPLEALLALTGSSQVDAAIEARSKVKDLQMFKKVFTNEDGCEKAEGGSGDAVHVEGEAGGQEPGAAGDLELQSVPDVKEEMEQGA